MFQVFPSCCLYAVASLPALGPWAPPAERGPSLESIYRVSLTVDLCKGNKIISFFKFISQQPVGGPSKEKNRGPWARAQCAHWLRRPCLFIRTLANAYDSSGRQHSITGFCFCIYHCQEWTGCWPTLVDTPADSLSSTLQQADVLLFIRVFCNHVQWLYAISNQSVLSAYAARGFVGLHCFNAASPVLLSVDRAPFHPKITSKSVYYAANKLHNWLTNMACFSINILFGVYRAIVNLEFGNLPRSI